MSLKKFNFFFFFAGLVRTYLNGEIVKFNVEKCMGFDMLLQNYISKRHNSSHLMTIKKSWRKILEIIIHTLKYNSLYGFLYFHIE